LLLIIHGKKVPKLLALWAPKFLGRDYNIEHTFDHVAKFHGDRPRELRGLAEKKKEKEKKTSAVKHNTSRY